MNTDKTETKTLVIKPKKILIKKDQARKVFESLDITIPLIPDQNKENNSTSNNVN